MGRNGETRALWGCLAAGRERTPTQQGRPAFFVSSPGRHSARTASTAPSSCAKKAGTRDWDGGGACCPGPARPRLGRVHAFGFRPGVAFFTAPAPGGRPAARLFMPRPSPPLRRLLAHGTLLLKRLIHLSPPPPCRPSARPPLPAAPAARLPRRPRRPRARPPPAVRPSLPRRRLACTRWISTATSVRGIVERRRERHA